MRKYIKYLLVIPVVAAVLLAVPASRPAEANGGIGFNLSIGVPLYYPYPSYYFSYPAYPAWGWRGYGPGYGYPRYRHYYPRHNPRFRGYDHRGYYRW